MRGEPTEAREQQLDGCVAVAALMSSGDFEQLGRDARVRIAAGANLGDLREAAYVASLFCGFPRGVAALVVLRELSDQEPAREPPPTDRPQTRAIGEQTFRTIHRRNAGRQLEMLERIHPDLADTILTEAYGRVLSRDLLPLAVREIVGAVSLAVQGLVPQLRAHLLGAHNSGAAWPTIERALRLGFELAGNDRDRGTIFDLLAELRHRVPD